MGRRITTAGRRRVLSMLVLLATVGWSTTVHASSGSTPAERAAAEIQAARDRADAAAQALFDKESEIDQLALDIAATEEQLAEVEARLDDMRSGLEAQAVRQYVGAGGPNFPLLIDLDRTNDVLAADVMASVAADTVHADLDEFDALRTDVEEQREELSTKRSDAETAAETYATLRTTAEREVVRLGEIEEQRLIDEAVQQELDRQRRAREEQERQEREAAAAQAEADAAAAAAAAATAQPVAAASDASSGTGAPAPVQPTPAPSNAGSGLTCPVAGPRSFADTWGAPRSGGRRHEGVDVMAPGGTPLVAMESGRIEFRSNKLGGNTLRLYGSSGTRYYYAHLSAYEGSNRSVQAGDVVGYVGRTGNTSANHLHLQIHPGGGQPVNPYPYVRRACG